ncbi:[histone H3]-lysine4 N-trimethyltransferase MLL3 [Sarotherodon galilaeus]
MTGHLTGKNGKILEMGKEIMSVCDQAGIKGDMRCSLAKVLLEAAKASEEKEEKLRKELDGANILEKRGVKDRIKEEEEKRARLAAWGISCQGLEHWMREPVEEEAQVPVNLMGRDLLIKLGAVIMCGPDGLTVTLKDGTQLPCVATGTRGQWLLSEDIDRTAEIYWARLTTSNGILAHFQLWRPWIMALDVYAPPIDPYHVTLFYDRDNTEWYEDLFHEFLEGKAWQVSTRDIYVGPQGRFILDIKRRTWVP